MSYYTPTSNKIWIESEEEKESFYHIWLYRYLNNSDFNFSEHEKVCEDLLCNIDLFAKTIITTLQGLKMLVRGRREEIISEIISAFLAIKEGEFIPDSFWRDVSHALRSAYLDFDNPICGKTSYIYGVVDTAIAVCNLAANNPYLHHKYKRMMGLVGANPVIHNSTKTLFLNLCAYHMATMTANTFSQGGIELPANLRMYFIHYAVNELYGKQQYINAIILTLSKKLNLPPPSL